MGHTAPGIFQVLARGFAARTVFKKTGMCIGTSELVP
jgi:hypothetical protein